MPPIDLKSAFILLTIALAAFLPTPVTSQLPTNKPTFVSLDCNKDNSGAYTGNSPYRRNLDIVLSDLTSHASTAPFYNSSAGPTDGPDTAYGQYYCRGDVSKQLCGDCVKAAAKVASNGTDCFGVRDGNIWFEECTLHYDNKSSVGLWDYTLTPDWSLSDGNVSDPTKFEQVLGSLIKTLIKKAAYGGDPMEFATGEANVTEYATVYCLLQCSPVISGLLCESCLKAGLRYLVDNYFGHDPEEVLLFYPNCQLRYGLSPFFLMSSDLAPTPTGSPATPSSSGRIPSSFDASPSGKDAKHYVTRIVIPVVVGSAVLTCIISFSIWFCLSRSMIRNAPPKSSLVQDQPPIDDPEIGSVECFSFTAIEDATNKFSQDNKLGQGGFGVVYKGILPNGQTVAIKRLSRHSSAGGQGIREFKTEASVLAKLQHRNLVRLLGFCDEHEERILVYEYLPNLSLDKYIKDATMSVKLDWKARTKIIEGLAWGLRYLHIDSLLTIVHRDLKPSNILLDEEMNPKIADFGMAKLVRIDETAGDTSRIAGTYGYMAPEYAMKGRFSTKSDIYSFGVIILEVLCGKSSNHFYDSESGEELLHHAWKIWNDKEIERLVDPTLQDNYSKTEVERFLQIGLLCVQDDAVRRPTIRVVVSMLENPFFELPSPSLPSS